MDHATDYNRVKEAILHKYSINEEVYRRRFREPDVRPGESPRELYTRLRDLFEKWIRPADKSVEEVAEVLILEQFLRTLAPDIRIWVKEHQPQSGQGAAELVENFMAARRGQKSYRQESYSIPAAQSRSGGFGHASGSKTNEPNRSWCRPASQLMWWSPGPRAEQGLLEKRQRSLLS
uniref:SCAN box domain-containing protein n=1 Tax=Gadus morhua TaxID=8049 RepID=A0A8C5CV84_GADMO